MGRFDGRVALVTGAASGIGRASALAFAAEGARVVVADLDDAHGRETVDLIAGAGGEAVFAHTDVADSASVQAMVSTAVERFGRLDYAHNNAGITGAGARVADIPEQAWERGIGVMLTGVFLCMKYEIPHILAAGGGAIVNTSSGAGLTGYPGVADYVAAKHGVIGLTRTAALEYATQNLRVNAVCPGTALSPMVDNVIRRDPEMERKLTALHPIGRLGRPEEIAAAVIWLCSDEASFVIGHPLVVDGGYTVP